MNAKPDGWIDNVKGKRQGLEFKWKLNKILPCNYVFVVILGRYLSISQLHNEFGE